MNNRNSDIDICKDIGIISMVVGHVCIGWIFNRFIHAFHSVWGRGTTQIKTYQRLFDLWYSTMP